MIRRILIVAGAVIAAAIFGVGATATVVALVPTDESGQQQELDPLVGDPAVPDPGSTSPKPSGTPEPSSTPSPTHSGSVSPVTPKPPVVVDDDDDEDEADEDEADEDESDEDESDNSGKGSSYSGKGSGSGKHSGGSDDD